MIKKFFILLLFLEAILNLGCEDNLENREQMLALISKNDTIQAPGAKHIIETKKIKIDWENSSDSFKINQEYLFRILDNDKLVTDVMIGVTNGNIAKTNNLNRDYNFKIICKNIGSFKMKIFMQDSLGENHLLKEFSYFATK